MVVKFNKNIKYSKFCKIFKVKGISSKIKFISGSVLLRTKGVSFMSLKEVESSRRFLRKYCKKKKGKLHIRVTPFQQLTYKSVGTRMGKGKGKKVKDFLCRIKPGKILFEFEKNIKRQRLIIRLFVTRICGIFFILKKKLSVNVSVFYKFKRR